MSISLITLAEYKAYVGVTSPTQDIIFNAIIPKVSNLVKMICRRSFVDYVNESKVDVFKGGPSFQMTESPLIGTPSVSYSSDFGATYSDLAEYRDYVLDLENGLIVPLYATEFPRLVNGYKITYNCGYDPIPEDLKLAVFDLVTYYVKNDVAIHSNKALGANSVQIEYVTNTGLPATIRRVLDLYTECYV